LRDGLSGLGSQPLDPRGKPITTFSTAHADHFIARIRCGIDAVENLVLTDRRCNNDKRDLLPGTGVRDLPGPATTSSTTPRSPIWSPLPRC
jgi:5-methylcytosine-specific restriction endonuclease McrA